MAKTLKLDLSVFKASGVYTLEFDASENIIINPQTIRLVIGYSNIGPFNTPVYCPDVTTFLSIFGDIDRTLEKKGSFFHRSALTCLEAGPIFALNLRILNNSVNNEGNPNYAAGADVARYRAFSVDTEEHNGANATGGYSDPLTKQDKLLSSYYNKENFWFPDTTNLLATLDNSGTKSDNKKLFSIVNLGQNPVSVIVRKSKDSTFPLRGFDITAREYFGPNNVPPYMNEYDYISDWFIDVIVISGNWTDYQSLSNDPIFSSYFTPKGLIKSKIDDFLVQNGVNLVLSVTGTLIPNFVDNNGTLRYIQTLINNETPRTGIFCAVNEEALDNLYNNPSVFDLVGHHLIDEIGPDADLGTNKSLNFLSYEQNLFADFTYYKNVGGGTGGSEIIYTNTSPDEYLLETGTILENTLYNAIGDSGILTSLFKSYNSSLRDGGAICLDTNFTGSNHDEQIKALKNFVTVTPDEPAERWVLGKVTNLPNSGYPEFNNGDLVKLKL